MQAEHKSLALELEPKLRSLRHKALLLRIARELGEWNTELLGLQMELNLKGSDRYGTIRRGHLVAHVVAREFSSQSRHGAFDAIGRDPHDIRPGERRFVGEDLPQAHSRPRVGVQEERLVRTLDRSPRYPRNRLVTSSKDLDVRHTGPDPGHLHLQLLQPEQGERILRLQPSQVVQADAFSRGHPPGCGGEARRGDGDSPLGSNILSLGSELLDPGHVAPSFPVATLQHDEDPLTVTGPDRHVDLALDTSELSNDQVRGL